MWRSTRHQRSPSRAENQAAVGGLSANCWRIIRLSASRVPCCAGGAQPMPDCYEVETWTRIPLRPSVRSTNPGSAEASHYRPLPHFLEPAIGLEPMTCVSRVRHPVFDNHSTDLCAGRMLSSLGGNFLHSYRLENRD